MNTETKTHKESSFLIVSADGDGFTRDIQIYTKALPDNDDVDFHDDEAGWRDFSGAVVISVYAADSKTRRYCSVRRNLRNVCIPDAI